MCVPVNNHGGFLNIKTSLMSECTEISHVAFDLSEQVPVLKWRIFVADIGDLRHRKVLS